VTTGDRYEPLPGLLEIPGFLVRKLSPRGRRIAAATAALLAVALAAGLALAIPAIVDDKRERAATDQRTSAQIRAERTARLEAEMRLVRGTGAPARGLEGAAAIAARRALAADLAAAVAADAKARVAAGELDRDVDRAQCERYPRGARGEDPATNLGRPTGRYACLAVSADVPGTSYNEGSAIGYPYRALVDFERGRFTFCKISGKPGEGSLRSDHPVTVPAACGG
jgi:hypothetical protein